jgi:hypothetical protein
MSSVKGFVIDTEEEVNQRTHVNEFDYKSALFHGYDEFENEFSKLLDRTERDTEQKNKNEIFNEFIKDHSVTNNTETSTVTYLKLFSRLFLMNQLSGFYQTSALFISVRKFYEIALNTLNKIITNIRVEKDKQTITTWLEYYTDNNGKNIFESELQEWLLGSKETTTIIKYRYFDLLIQQQEFKKLPIKSTSQIISELQIENYRYVSNLDKVQEVREFVYITEHNKFSFFDKMQVNDFIPFAILGEFVKMKLDFYPKSSWYNENAMQTVNHKNSDEIIAKLAFSGKYINRIKNDSDDKLYMTISFCFESEWELLTYQYPDILLIRGDTVEDRDNSINDIESLRNDKKLYRLKIRVILKTADQIQQQDDIKKRIETCFSGITEYKTQPAVIPSTVVNARYKFFVRLEEPLNVVLLKDMFTNNPTLCQFFQVNDQYHFTSKTSLRIFYFTYIPFRFENGNDFCQCQIEQGKLYTPSYKQSVPKELFLKMNEKKFPYMAQISIQTNKYDNAVQFYKMFQKLITIYNALKPDYHELYRSKILNMQFGQNEYWNAELFSHIVLGFNEEIKEQQQSSVDLSIDEKEEQLNLLDELNFQKLEEIHNLLKVIPSEPDRTSELQYLNTIEHWKKSNGNLITNIKNLRERNKTAYALSHTDNETHQKLKQIFTYSAYKQLQEKLQELEITKDSDFTKKIKNIEKEINNLENDKKKEEIGQEELEILKSEIQKLKFQKQELEYLKEYSDWFLSSRLFPREDDVYENNDDYKRIVYSCNFDENGKNIHIGLRENEAENKQKYPYLPVCYKIPNENMTQYYDIDNPVNLQDLGKKQVFTEKSVYKVKAENQCNPNSKGYLPSFIQSLFAMDDLETMNITD